MLLETLLFFIKLNTLAIGHQVIAPEIYLFEEEITTIVAALLCIGIFIMMWKAMDPEDPLERFRGKEWE